MDINGKFFGYSLIIKDSVLYEYRMLKRPIKGCEDGNGVYVKHGDCKAWMEFHDDKWICPVCGGKILKSAAYEFIEELNEEGRKKFEDDYDEYW